MGSIVDRHSRHSPVRAFEHVLEQVLYRAGVDSALLSWSDSFDVDMSVEGEA